MAFAIADVKFLSSLAMVQDQGIQYRRLYHVYFTGTFDEVALLYNTDSRLPKRLDDHPSDATAYCQQVTIKVLDSDSPNPGAGQQSLASYDVIYAQKDPNFAANPLLRPAVIRWGGTDITETVRADIHDKAINNSAGVLYTTLPERPIRGAECSIQRNESANPAATIANYSYSVNDAAIFPIGGVNQVAAENALMGKIEAQKVNELFQGSIITYWQVTYPIRFRNDSWRLKLLDNGFEHLNSDPKLVPNESPTGGKYSTPQLLDGHGGLLAHGSTPVIYPSVANGDAQDGYSIHFERTWSALSLPNPFA